MSRGGQEECHTQYGVYTQAYNYIILWDTHATRTCMYKYVCGLVSMQSLLLAFEIKLAIETGNEATHYMYIKVHCSKLTYVHVHKVPRERILNIAVYPGLKTCMGLLPSYQFSHLMGTDRENKR